MCCSLLFCCGEYEERRPGNLMWVMYVVFRHHMTLLSIMRIMVAYVWACMTHHMNGRNFILTDDDTDAYFVGER